ncbi:MAG TPA: hypothetical protein VFQ38_07235 [Longimicrobiales bacterium]|nr:hypothetical protein [Longimicrobiales bacterium]
MALGLCTNDPLVTTLRDVFGANIVRVPEERIRPVTVLASHGRKTAFRGALAPLLAGGGPVDVPVAKSGVANLSGRRSISVQLDLGLKILGGFLKALQLPAAGIDAQFEGACKVSFQFQDVKRFFVDTGVLGQRLGGRIVDRGNPATSIFFEDDWTFLVVDSVITSSDFAIHVDEATKAGFAIDLPAVQQIVSGVNAGVQVASASGRDLAFKGDRQLTFAFTCVRLFLNADGRITAMPPADDVPAMAAKSRRFGAAEHVVRYTPDRILLMAEPAMVDLDLRAAPVPA